MLIAPKDRIVFFGDSLTKRTGRMDSEIPADRYAVSYVESYVDLLVKRLLIHFPQLEFTIYNRGVGGDTVLNLLERYQKDVLPLKPSILPAGMVPAGQHPRGAAFYLCASGRAQDGFLGTCRPDSSVFESGVSGGLCRC